MAANPPRHLLRLVLSSRQLTAQVTTPSSETIVAIASSSEPEFVPQHWTRLARSPRARTLWDADVAARIGEKLGLRLRDIGVSAVEIDAGEELARPPHYRRRVSSLFDSVERAGVTVDGSEKLRRP